MATPIAQGLAVQLIEDLTPEDVCAVLAVFRDDLERLSGTLREAADVADLELFRRISHSLAGAAGAVGAAPLEVACRQAMKASARERNPPHSQRTFGCCPTRSTSCAPPRDRTWLPASRGSKRS